MLYRCRQNEKIDEWGPELRKVSACTENFFLKFTLQQRYKVSQTRITVDLISVVTADTQVASTVAALSCRASWARSSSQLFINFKCWLQ
jgi:hypothetical protein